MATKHYVVSDKGKYGLLYVNDHGYYFIVTPRKVYPSGKGFAPRWLEVKDEDIPQDAKVEIDKAFDRRKAKLDETVVSLSLAQEIIKLGVRLFCINGWFYFTNESRIIEVSPRGDVCIFPKLDWLVFNLCRDEYLVTNPEDFANTSPRVLLVILEQLK